MKYVIMLLVGIAMVLCGYIPSIVNAIGTCGSLLRFFGGMLLGFSIVSLVMERMLK